MSEAVRDSIKDLQNRISVVGEKVDTLEKSVVRMEVKMNFITALAAGSFTAIILIVVGLIQRVLR